MINLIKRIFYVAVQEYWTDAQLKNLDGFFAGLSDVLIVILIIAVVI